MMTTAPRIGNIRYLVRSTVNPKLVLCTDGEFHYDAACGPGGFCAKLYKTEKGALATGRGTAHKCDAQGVES